jgi:hypothetical protein
MIAARKGASAAGVSCHAFFLSITWVRLDCERYSDNSDNAVNH